MTRLSWHQEVNRKFEFGIDHGVLYPENDSAVPWNGLISVNKTPETDGASSYHFDGIKYLEMGSRSTYQGTITAVSHPPEFNDALGNTSVSPGFILTKQQRSKFGLSYRTKIGEDLGYKIHLVYNAVVKSSNIAYEKINATMDVKTLSWTIDTIPSEYSGLNPSSHFVFDSTNMLPGNLEYLETIIYGTEENIARLPTMFELTNIFENWKPYLIDFTDSGTSALIPQDEVGDLAALKIDGIFVPIHTTRLGSTSDPGIYRLES